MFEKRLIQIAHILSVIFSPFYAPIWAFLWLFFFSYLKLLPLGYKLLILGIVFVFTILIPRLTINVFRRLNRWSHWQLSHREHRHMPYVLTLLSYSACLMLFTQLNVAMFFRGIIMSAIVAQIVCVIINVWWKISVHMVSIGGLAGLVGAFSSRFGFDPVWPVCTIIMLGGLMGSSQMLLRQHDLIQVVVGFFVGILCARLTFMLWVW